MPVRRTLWCNTFKTLALRQARVVALIKDAGLVAAYDSFEKAAMDLYERFQPFWGTKIKLARTLKNKPSMTLPDAQFRLSRLVRPPIQRGILFPQAIVCSYKVESARQTNLASPLTISTTAPDDVLRPLTFLVHGCGRTGAHFAMISCNRLSHSVSKPMRKDTRLYLCVYMTNQDSEIFASKGSSNLVVGLPRGSQTSTPG